MGPREGIGDICSALVGRKVTDIMEKGFSPTRILLGRHLGFLHPYLHSSGYCYLIQGRSSAPLLHDICGDVPHEKGGISRCSTKV